MWLEKLNIEVLGELYLRVNHKGPRVAMCVPDKVDFSINQSKIKQAFRGRISKKITSRIYIF